MITTADLRDVNPSDFKGEWNSKKKFIYAHVN